MKNSLQKALRQKSRTKDNNLQELFPFWSSFSLKVHTVGLKLTNVQEKNKQEKNYIDYIENVLKTYDVAAKLCFY